MSEIPQIQERGNTFILGDKGNVSLLRQTISMIRDEDSILFPSLCFCAQVWLCLSDKGQRSRVT